MTKRLESAQLFIPGRASYITSSPDGAFKLNLTDASLNRSEVAKNIFDANFHDSAVFAGGYPAIQNWPTEHIPPLGEREADLMAVPLETRLEEEGWDQDAIHDWVKKQGFSTNSIGDVLASIQQGLIDPNDFNKEAINHGIELVSGKLHGLRFRLILQKALDIDPDLISRASMKDVYGTPTTEFQNKELPAIAIAKEVGAIAITKLVLKHVRSGNIDDLADAEQRFAAIAARNK
jgi:hypothetical protein